MKIFIERSDNEKENRNSKYYCIYQSKYEKNRIPFTNPNHFNTSKTAKANRFMASNNNNLDVVLDSIISYKLLLLMDTLTAFNELLLSSYINCFSCFVGQKL